MKLGNELLGRARGRSMHSLEGGIWRNQCGQAWPPGP